MTDEINKPANPDRRKFLKDASLIPAGLYLGAGAAAADGQARTTGAGESMMGFAMASTMGWRARSAS